MIISFEENMKKIKNGFTLIEILLVIGVIMIMSIIKIRDINSETEDMQAKMLAGQIQTVAEATNAFLVLKYNELSNLSSPGVSCNTAANTCNITLQNLSDNALLPPNFSSNTILGNPYEIQLKRTGTAPNYMISGLVLTKGNKNTENTPSLVFLGKALRDIGRDGGLNKNTGKIIGTSNGWSADSTLFPILSNKVNYIGSAVGTLSGAYYVYLRRDGTLPMTGDLNMDGHNINNVNNLNATGNISTVGNIQGKNIHASSGVSSEGNVTANGDVVSGNWLYAKNGYGDVLSIGGDSGAGGLGPDYEIKLFANKPLTLHSPNSKRGSDIILDIDGNTRIQTNLSTNSLNPNDIPSGWAGGLRTQDIYASGTIGAGVNGKVNTYMNSSGKIYASGNIEGSTITSNNLLTANNLIQVNGIVNEGDSCANNGLIGRTSDGTSMYCVNGYWTNIISNKNDSGGMILPGGMKIMWGKVSANVYKFQNNVYESDFYRVNPTFVANGTNYSFTKILNVQLTPFDKPNQNQETMWTTDSYNNGFSFAFSALSPGSMSGNYLAIGY